MPAGLLAWLNFDNLPEESLGSFWHHMKRDADRSRAFTKQRHIIRVAIKFVDIFFYPFESQLLVKQSGISWYFGVVKGKKSKCTNSIIHWNNHNLQKITEFL